MRMCSTYDLPRGIIIAYLAIIGVEITTDSDEKLVIVSSL